MQVSHTVCGHAFENPSWFYLFTFCFLTTGCILFQGLLSSALTTPPCTSGPTWICESSTQTSRSHSGKRQYTIIKNEYKHCFLPAGVLALAGRWSYFHTAISSMTARCCFKFPAPPQTELLPLAITSNKSNLRTFLLTTASLCTHHSDVDVIPTRQGAFLRRSLSIKEKSRATVFQYFLAISWCVQLSGQLIL